MLKLKKTAVTGSLSAGKSSVCQILKGLGAYVISADAIVHQLLSKHPRIIEQVRASFGPGVFTKDAIDRKKLAEAAFAHPEKLAELEALLHPEVRLIIEEHYKKACEEGSADLFVAEIPLLFESNRPFDFDAVIAVDAPLEMRLERSGLERNDFLRREARQAPPEVKRSRASFVITNDADLVHLQKQVEDLHRSLTHPKPLEGD